jgi:beta-glucanase (GH16 family)
MTIGVKDYGGAESRASFDTATYTEADLSFTTGFANTTATIYAFKPEGDAAGYADTLTLTYEGPSPYTLVWSDEFDGSGAPDDTKWQFEEGFVRNEELQWYQPDNAIQEDGLLVIEGREEDRPNPSHVPGSSDWRTARETISYTSSSIKTKDRFSWQYGHLVVRAKVTNLAGTWPAIWTLGVDCEWPSNGEVDVMENYGGDILANFAWGTDHRWSPEWDSSHWPVTDFGTGWTDDFHLWELQWTETQMIIRLDGTVLNTVTLSDTINGSAACAGENPFQQPHYLLINLALGGSAGGSVDDLTFPTRYWVDYVRIYQ